jgi:hypothetical protein
VNNLVRDLYAAELQQRVIAQPFIMIAGDIDDARTLAYLAQDLLDYVVVGLRPTP